MEHFDNFDVRDEVKAEVDIIMRYKDVQNDWVCKAPVFTLFYNDKPIMIYAMFPDLMGTYIVTVYAGKGMDKHVHAMVRCIYKYVDEFVGDDVRRFEAYTACTDKQTLRLAKFFGFEIVGFRRQAGADGSDQVILERLWRK